MVTSAVSSAHLDRKLRQLFRKGIGLQLLFVSKRLKPCYLWDLCEPAVATADECIRHSNQTFDTTQLRSIQIGDSDLVVCNTETTLRHLNDVLSSSNNVRFVDVSSRQKRPQLLTSLPYGLEAMLRSLLRQLDNLNEQKNPQLELESDWNMCSAFGVFLGFPVVYWFSADSDANCLSMEELKVFSVRCLKSELGSGPGSELYSFSFPLCLEPELGPHVRSWLEDLRTRAADFELATSSRVCCYPTVAL